MALYMLSCWPRYAYIPWHYFEPRESMRTIRQRYWSHLLAQRREAAFPAALLPHSHSVRPVGSVRIVRPRTIQRARFQRKRRQVVQTHLRRLRPSSF